jgi:hypothetical protein
MSDYYFDIETYGKGDKVNLRDDEIITIQYQNIDSRTGQPKSPLVILKAWESSEKDILTKFYDIFKPNDRWAFVPIGCYLSSFDLPKLYYRWRNIGLSVDSNFLFFEHAYFDIKPILVLLNNGAYNGAKLEKFAGKAQSGSNIKSMYEAKDYQGITKYIEDETVCYLNLYKYLVQNLYPLWINFAKENKLII